MPKKPIIAFLIVLLSVPLNAGAASSWMALSMSDTGPPDELAMEAMEAMEKDQHSLASDHHSAHQLMDHSLHAVMEQTVDSEGSHDHNTEDCDEYCMSCSNHCSSTAIISQSRACFEPGLLHSRTSPAATLTHPKLLFRPPIHTWWIRAEHATSFL